MASRGGGMMEQALRGQTAQPGEMAPAPQEQDHGFGTQVSEYAPPSAGPFECENCSHWDESQPKSCNEPHVIADPEVEKVEAEGCCRFFDPAGSETQEEEHGEEE